MEAISAAFFFLFFFSVLPFERGWVSRNSAACGTALQSKKKELVRYRRVIIQKEKLKADLPSVSDGQHEMCLSRLLLPDL